MDSITHIESTHSIYVNKLASHQVNKLNEFWGGYYRLLMNSLNGYDSDITRTQLNKLIKEIGLTITSNMEEWQEQLQLDLNEFAGYETDFQAKAIGGFTSEAIAVPATEQVIAAAISTPISLGSAGAISLNPWLADLTRKQKTLIENEVKLGYANGVPTNQLVQRIVGTRRNNFTDGVADVTRRQAVTLVRTTTNHYASVARRNVYEKNKRVVIGHRWISTLDKRTSNICRGRDGKEYYYDSGESVEYPPAHPGCRSSTSPIIKGYNSTNPKGLRAAKGGKMEDGKLKTDPGQASSATTYYEWLKNQPAQFQDEVLGKTKGKIFRNSGVTVDKFKTLLLDEMNKPATIAQLAAKDKKIAAYLANM